MSKCVITAEDTVQVTAQGFLVNGVFKPSLAGCTLKEGVRFIVPTMDVPSAAAPAPVVFSPAANHVAPQQTPATAQPTAQQPVSTVQEIGELQEIMALVDTLSGASPLMTIAILAAFAWMKFNKIKAPQSCIACTELEPRVSKLEAADRATDKVLAVLAKDLASKDEQPVSKKLED